MNIFLKTTEHGFEYILTEKGENLIKSLNDDFYISYNKSLEHAASKYGEKTDVELINMLMDRKNEANKS